MRLPPLHKLAASWAAFGLGLLALPAAGALTEEQSRLALEADAPRTDLKRIVLLAGGPSNRRGQHEYLAGCALLAEALRKVEGVWPVLVAHGWPVREDLLDGASAVVVYADGGAKLPFLPAARRERMNALMEKGAGLVMLHQAVDVPAEIFRDVQGWLGAAWQPDIGCRGHWDMEFSEPADREIARGVQGFAAPLDGWLFNLHFLPGVVPLLSGAVPDKARTTEAARAALGRMEVVAWSYQRPRGGRSFGFTGCDLHRNWGVEGQRRFVLNGILWAAGVPVPGGGTDVSLVSGALEANLDAKP
jgi:hypothetical protein